jgi:hypothetical protein
MTSISRVLSTKYQLYQRQLLFVPMRMLEQRVCNSLGAITANPAFSLSI